MDFQIAILLVSFLALLFMNVPIAICIAVASMLTMYTIPALPVEYLTAQRLANGIASFPLLAIPFFILAGILMGEGGMARRLMRFADWLVGGLRGGLCYVNTTTCMLFGAVSGSASAAVSSVGTFMIPEMERNGYRREFSVALTTTSATTGLLIPPSNIMIVFAVVSGNVSVAALFFAGVLPGILMGSLLMLAAFLFHTARRGETGEKRREKALSMGERIRIIGGAVPTLLLMVIILGGILGGVFSATEASAIAVLYAGFTGIVVHREIPLRSLPGIPAKAAKTNAVVMFLIGSSQLMSWILAHEQIPAGVSEAMLGLTDNPVFLLILINLILLFVGVFMDMTPAVLIFTPILLPVALSIGIDPLHFGVLMITNLCIGLCTPPVGTCLFVGCSVGKTTLTNVIPSLIPLFLAMILGLLAISFFPQLSLWLPGILGF